MTNVILLTLLYLTYLPQILAGGSGHGHGGGLAPALDILKKKPILEKSETIWTTFQNGVSLSCNQTSLAVYIPHTAVLDPSSNQPVSNNLIFWQNDGSQHCRSNEYNTTHYLLAVDIAEWQFPCGTTRDSVSDEYRIKYENKIGFVRGKEGLELLANIQCSIQKDKNVAVLPDSSSNTQLETIWGRFQLKTSFFYDSEFVQNEALSTRDAAPKVQVGKSLFGKTEIIKYPEDKEKEDMPEIVVTELNCVATKSPNFKDSLVTENDKFTLKFLKNRCVGDDKTVIIKRNGESSLSEFKFQMFKWKNTINQYVYIHCQLALCNQKETNNKCSGLSENYNCHGDITLFKKQSNGRAKINGMGSTARAMAGSKKRKKRSLTEIPLPEAIDNRWVTVHSFGPIIPWDTSVIAPTLDRTKEEQKLINLLNHGIDPNNPSEKVAAKIVVGVVACFSLISLVVLSSVFYKKFIKTRRWEELLTPVQQGKNEIEQGFVFVLRSSTDPVLPKEERDKQEELENQDNDSDNDKKRRGHRKKKKKRKDGGDDDDKKRRKKKRAKSRGKSMREDGEGHRSRHRRRTKDGEDEDGEDRSPSRRRRGRSKVPHGFIQEEDENGENYAGGEGQEEEGEGHSPSKRRRRKHREGSRAPKERGKSRMRETSVIPEENEEEVEAAENGGEHDGERRRRRHTSRARSERPRGRSERPRERSEMPAADKAGGEDEEDYDL